MRRTVLIAVGTVLVLWLAIVVAAWALQDSLIYFPDRNVPPPGATGLRGLEEARFAADDGTALHGWFLPPPGGAAPRATVVLFHGNAGNIAGRAWKIERLAAAGFAALVFDYRGYGKSAGAPSEPGLYADGRAAVRWAREREKAPIVFYGESLGCAVAVELALDDPPAGLVLEAPFSSIAAVGRHHYRWLPVGTLLRARYDNLAKIGRVRAPLLVIHGERDEVIPFAQGRALFEAAAAAPRKRLHAVPDGGHNDSTYFDFRPLVEGIGEMLVSSPPG